MRETVCLNGFWDFAVCDNMEQPELPKAYDDTQILVPCPFDINGFLPLETRNIDGEEVVLKGAESNLFPEYDEKWERAKAGFYRREFFVPKEWENRKVTLKFDAVLFYSECYINKTHVHTDCDGFLPFEFVINDYVKFGENNEIIVYTKNADQFAYMDDGHKRIEYPKGSFWGEKVTGIWQDVYLKSYPKLHVSDIFVTTDIADHKCNAKVTLDGDLPQNSTLHFTLSEYKGDKTYDLGSVAAGGNTVDFTYDYSAIKDEVKLWAIREPNLYYMTVSLRDAQGQELDTMTVRFGFRSIEVRGKKIYLNGYPVILKQDSWHYLGFMYQTEEYARKWFQMEMEVNVNTIRLHAQPYPAFFLDIADEMGMMIVGESAVWGSHCQFHNSDKYIENCKNHVERMIKRDRNHPCVIIWSIENECLRAYGVSRDDAVKNVEELAEKLAPIGEHARKIDSTRIMCAEGSRDLGGTMDIFSLHYTGLTSPETDKPVTMGEMGSMYYSKPSGANDYIGEEAFYSQNNRWENLGQEAFYTLKYQRKWAAGVCIFNVVWYGLNPLRFKERMLTYDDYTTPGVKIRKVGEFMGTINAGYDPDLPDYSPNPVFPWVKKGFEPERTFFENENRAFFSGEKACVKISVHNDSRFAKTYAVVARLYQNTTLVLETTVDVDVAACEYTFADIVFDSPLVDTMQEYRLELSLTHDGALVCTDEEPVKIFNKDYLKGLLPNTPVAVAGDNGTCVFDGLQSIDRYEDNKYAAVIVCDGVSDELYSQILNGSTPVLDFTTKFGMLEGKVFNKNVRKGFIAPANEELRRNLTSSDLMGITGDLFADKVFELNLDKNFIQLVTNGNGETVVVQLPGDKHTHIISASPFTDLSNPVALQLMINLINYTQQVSKPLSTGIVIADEDSDLVKCLTELHVFFKRISPDDKATIKAIKGADVIIADGSGNLAYVNELTADNTKNLHIFGMHNQNIPKHMRGLFSVQDKKCYQFKLNEDSALTDTILASDLYATDHRIPLTKNPIKILDPVKFTNIASTTNVDWRAWNDIAEYRKTITILRTELVPNEHLSLWCSLMFNGMKVCIDQLDVGRDYHKIKILIKKLLTNMGIRFDSQATNAEIDLIYDEKVVKNLLINTANGNSQIIDHNADTVIPAGTYDHVVYVNSPQDRTDLLRNPDLIYMKYSSAFETEFYVNDKPVTEGTTINLNVLPLKLGENKLTFRQKRDKDSSDLFTLIIKRKGNLPLDLTFGLGDM